MLLHWLTSAAVLGGVAGAGAMTALVTALHFFTALPAMPTCTSARSGAVVGSQA
jgi:hypothetical protein